MSGLQLRRALAAAVLGVAVEARADMGGAVAPGSMAQPALHSAHAESPSPDRPQDLDLGVFSVGDLPQDIWDGDALAASLASGWPLPPGGIDLASSPHAEVRELPALPGSAQLFLSAMLSMGGWQLVRSARHLHWGGLPEWYHTGGPLQIGHAVPFDLDFSASPPCCFEQPAGERPYLYRVRRELCPRCDAPRFLTIFAPRGPPGIS